LATSNEEGKTYIPSSLEPCAPPIRALNDGRAHMCPCQPRGVRLRPSLGACVYAPLGRACPPSAPPVAARTSLAVRAFLTRACLSHPSVPLPCAPPEYKFHKLVVHSTTWASGPLTTERWLTAGCLGSDHYFYIHSHSPTQGCACMHVTFHVFLFIFIVNAYQLGGHIKLLASLYTF
jgi:hypothetical protein